jgi:addiction module HigA family antidote
MAFDAEGPPPLSPGEVLREDFLRDSKITQESLAAELGVSRVTVNQLLNDRRAVTADMALRLARVLGTTPDYWLHLQVRTDLYRANRRHGAEISKLTRLMPERDGPQLVSLEDLLLAGEGQDGA